MLSIDHIVQSFQCNISKQSQLLLKIEGVLNLHKGRVYISLTKQPSYLHAIQFLCSLGALTLMIMAFHKATIL